MFSIFLQSRIDVCVWGNITYWRILLIGTSLEFWICFKVLVLPFKALCGLGPAYLCDAHIYMPCSMLCKPTSPAVPSPRDMWLTLTRARRFFWLWPQPSGMGSSLISGPSGTCYRVWPFRFCPHANRSFKLSSLSRYVSLSYTAVCSKIQIANMGEFTDEDKNKSSCTDWILLL